MGCVNAKPNQQVQLKFQQKQKSQSSFKMQKTLSASQNQTNSNSSQKNSEKKNPYQQVAASPVSSNESIYQASDENGEYNNNNIIIQFNGKGVLDKQHPGNFDDRILFNEKNIESLKISAIKISYTDDFIEGLQIAYEANNGSIIPGKHNSIFIKQSKNEKKMQNEKNEAVQKEEQQSKKQHKNCYLLKEDVFEIPVDDYIVEIIGRKSEFLNQIQFVTQKGETSSMFGNSTLGKPFNLQKKGYTFGAFGAQFNNKNLIYQINFQLSPLPQGLNTSEFSDKIY